MHIHILKRKFEGFNEYSETPVCDICYLNCSIEAQYQLKKIAEEDAVSLNLGEEQQLDLENGENILSFVAPETGNYRFQYEAGEENDARIVICNAAGKRLSYSWSKSLAYDMTGGKQYYVAVVVDIPDVKEVACSISRIADRERKEIQSIDVSLHNPNAGGVLVIPETIDLKNNADVAKLGVDFTVGA